MKTSGQIFRVRFAQSNFINHLLHKHQGPRRRFTSGSLPNSNAGLPSGGIFLSRPRHAASGLHRPLGKRVPAWEGAL